MRGELSTRGTGTRGVPLAASRASCRGPSSGSAWGSSSAGTACASSGLPQVWPWAWGRPPHRGRLCMAFPGLCCQGFSGPTQCGYWMYLLVKEILVLILLPCSQVPGVIRGCNYDSPVLLQQTTDCSTPCAASFPSRLPEKQKSTPWSDLCRQQRLLSSLSHLLPGRPGR